MLLCLVFEALVVMAGLYLRLFVLVCVILLTCLFCVAGSCSPPPEGLWSLASHAAYAAGPDQELDGYGSILKKPGSQTISNGMLPFSRSQLKEFGSQGSFVSGNRMQLGKSVPSMSSGSSMPRDVNFMESIRLPISTCTIAWCGYSMERVR